MKKRCFALVCAVMMLSLTACGSGGAKESYMTDAVAPAGEYAANSTDYFYDEEAAMAEMPEEAIDADKSSGENKNTSSAKLITTMNISAETEEFDTFVATVEAKVQQLGGYIESSNISNNSYGNYSTDRYGSMTIRVPAEQLENLLGVLSEKSNITNKSKNVEDVTLTYVDLESHKKALQAEEKRLLELMDMCETMEDIITIEDKLTDVRYQLQSMESQLRTYDNKIQYSTIYLNFSEVEKFTPIEEPGTWERISEGFVDNLHDVGYGLKEFFIGFIISIPVLVVWAVIIVIVVLIVKAIRKKSLAKKEAKAESAAKTGWRGAENFKDKESSKEEAKGDKDGE